MKKLWWFLALVIVAILVFFFSDYMNAKRSLKAIEKEYKEYKSVKEATIALLNKAIDKKEEKIAEVNGALDSSNTIIAHLEEMIAGKDSDLAAIRKKWGTLSLECQANLRELDSVWGNKFSLAIDEIAELKNQVKLADERDLYRQGQILDLRKIIEAKDLQLVSCERASAEVAQLYLRERRASRLKTWVSAGLVTAGFLLGQL